MPKIPKLADVAAAQNEEAKTKKARGILASLGALLGISVKEAGAKYSKKTEVTKHTVTEEDDSDNADAEEDDEEAESEDSSDDADAEDEGSDADAEAMDSATDKPAEGAEDEEDDKKASAHKAAMKAAEAAYHAHVAANAPQLAASLALRSPRRLDREVRRATGAKSIDGAMTALSRFRAKNAEADAKVIAKLAKMEATLADVKKQSRAQRIDGIIASAKADGRAPNKTLRAQLREYGMANGSAALTKLVAALPQVRQERRVPREDANGEPLGAPNASEQKAMMDAGKAGLSVEEQKLYDELFAKTSAKYANGANGAGNVGGLS